MKPRSRPEQIFRLVRAKKVEKLFAFLSPTPDEEWTQAAQDAAQFSPEVLGAMLDRGLDPNVDPDFRSLVCIAAEWGHRELVRRLLDEGADPTPGFVLLDVVRARKPDPGILCMLIEAGAPLDATRPGCATALGWARSHDRRVLAEVLADHGAVLEHRPPRTLAELLDGVQSGEIEPFELDETLWERMAVGPQEITEMEALGRPLFVAWASRYLELEVGNGGFSQAAFNMLDEFAIAADAFDELGCPEVATLVREAEALAIAQGGPRMPSKGTTKELLALFQEALQPSELDAFDERAKAAGLGKATFDARIAYLLANREAVVAAAPEIERRAAEARERWKAFRADAPRATPPEDDFDEEDDDDEDDFDDDFDDDL